MGSFRDLLLISDFLNFSLLFDVDYVFSKTKLSHEVFMVTIPPYAGMNKWMKNNNELWEHNNNNYESKALIRNENVQSLEIYDDLEQMFKSIFNCYTMCTYMIIQ